MEKKEEIICAAAALFAEKGYAFPLADLAAAVNIKTPSLYSHFHSKEDIIKAAVRSEIASYNSELRALTDSCKEMSCRERLETLFTHMLVYMGESGGFWKNLMLVPNTELRKRCLDAIISGNKWFSDVLRSYFKDGVSAGVLKPGAEENAVYLYYTTILGLTDIILLSKSTDFDMRDYAERTWQIFWSGISAK